MNYNDFNRDDDATIQGQEFNQDQEFNDGTHTKGGSVSTRPDMGHQGGMGGQNQGSTGNVPDDSYEGGIEDIAEKGGSAIYQGNDDEDKPKDEDE